MGHCESRGNMNTDTKNNIKEFECSSSRDQLLKKLRIFLNQFEVQKTYFGNKKKLHDSVFESINEEETKELINFFNSNKNEFIREILNYLSLQQININPNNISQIINSENGEEFYNQKILDII